MITGPYEPLTEAEVKKIIEDFECMHRRIYFWMPTQVVQELVKHLCEELINRRRSQSRKKFFQRLWEKYGIVK